MKNILLIALCLLSTSSIARVTMDDVNRDMAWFAAQNPTVPQSVIDRKWDLYNQPPLEDDASELDAKTATNGYVILNKSQGLIKQWGRINLASRGTATVKFPHRMSNVYSINLTSSNAHLSSNGDGTIETSTRVSSYTSDQFKIVRGYVGDSKGHIGSVTVYWEATGKI
jgi:hypothetical protein